MRKTMWLAVLASLAPGSLAAQRPSLPADWASQGYVPGQVIVQLREDALDAPATASALREAGARSSRSSRFVRGLSLVALRAGDSVEAAARRFAGVPGVTYAEPNWLRRLDLTPNDPGFGVQWNFRQVGAERTWDIQRGSASVAVAVVDSGVAHEALGVFEVDLSLLLPEGSPPLLASFGPFGRAPDWGGTRFAAGLDALFGTGHAWDDLGHGTHVASTVAQATDNGIGLAGLAFGVTLMPIKACILGFCPAFAVAEGIDYATRNGARVINLSLSGPRRSETESRAVQRAAAGNVVLVAAAGNETGPVGFPAAFDEVVAVGALDQRRQRAFYSNFGPELDLAAPGGNTRVDVDGDGFADGVFQQTYDPDAAEQGIFTEFAYVGFQGTSMASPHVAAAAALLISQGITDARAVRRALEQTAVDLGAAGRDDQFGFGLIDPARALGGLGLNH